MAVDSVKSSFSKAAAAKTAVEAPPVKPPPPPPETPKVSVTPTTTQSSFEPAGAKAAVSAGAKASAKALSTFEPAAAKPLVQLTATNAAESAPIVGPVLPPEVQRTEAEKHYAAAKDDPVAHTRNITSHTDPDYRARYIELLAGSGQLPGVADVAMGLRSQPPPPGPGTIGPPQGNSQQAFVEALGAARAKGGITPGQLAHLATQSDGGHAAVVAFNQKATALWQVPVPAETPSQVQVREIETATATSQAKREKVKALNEQLSEELAGLGPALSEAQRQKYIETFRGRHPEFAEELAAAEALKTKLEGVDPRNPAVAKAAYAGAQELAQTPLAEHALGFVDGLLADPRAKAQYAKALGVEPAAFQKQLETTVRDPALGVMLTNALVETDDPQAAKERFFTELDRYKSLSENLSGWRDGVETVFDAATAAKKTGDFTGLAAIVQKGLGATEGLDQVLGTFAMGAGFMLAANNASEGDWLAMVKDIAGGTAGGLQMLADSTSLFSKAGKLGHAAKVVPAMGAIASVLGGVVHARDALEGDEKLWVSVLGDVMATAGFALAFTAPTGVGAAVSGGLIAVGTVISTGGELWSSWSEDAERRESQRSILRELGIERPEALVDNQSTLVTWSQTLALRPEQLQTIAARWPVALEGNTSKGLAATIGAYGLVGENAVQFLEKLEAEARAQGSSLGGAMRTLSDAGWLEGRDHRDAFSRMFPETATWAEAFGYSRGPATLPSVAPGQDG